MGLGAAGLEILSAMPREEAEMVITINTPEILRRYPQTTEGALRRAHEETRKQAYSAISGILSKGFWGIGVPVLGQGKPVAAVVLITSAVD